MKSGSIGVWLACVVIGTMVGGCSVHLPKSRQGQGTIHCAVVYREKMLIPEDAVTIVELVNTSVPKPFPVVTWSTVAGHTGPPISFSFEYERTDVDLRLTYGLQARIENDGKVLFASDEPEPVLTQGHGEKAEVLVRRVP